MTDMAALEGMDSKKYPELYHFTTGAGLQGVLRDCRLHSTHIEFLNDASEKIALLGSALLESEIVRITTTYPRPKEWPPQFRDLSETELQNRLREIFKTAVEGIAEIYVTSLSIPHSSWGNNGLLSQWRGYGQDGGYAIVFDTEGLQHLIGKEHDIYKHEYIDVNPVRYLEDSDADDGTFGIVMAMEGLMFEDEAELNKLLGGPDIAASDHDRSLEIHLGRYLLRIYASLHKNSGFMEEREARIVTVPRQSAGSGEKGFKTKVRKFKEKAGLLVPYIELFDELSSGVKLPIKRIIVGPHPDQKKRERSVRLLLEELEITVEDVVLSKIPYIGR